MMIAVGLILRRRSDGMQQFAAQSLYLNFTPLILGRCLIDQALTLIENALDGAGGGRSADQHKSTAHKNKAAAHSNKQARAPERKPAAAGSY